LTERAYLIYERDLEIGSGQKLVHVKTRNVDELNRDTHLLNAHHCNGAPYAPSFQEAPGHRQRQQQPHT